jgi:hypothetical protein
MWQKSVSDLQRMPREKQNSVVAKLMAEMKPFRQIAWMAGISARGRF